ncbi:uncharacterized protein LOC127286858 [Leptopilina boulardi]|uniref:uncharacterized protein LOC127286858 n=1 Tax=Leptopilina boulardi TaxID=63433 RepID=UPI0021F671E9|nr:uncharacterized protein LOC127286858 [Leptopilina boulardi]
MPFMQNVKTIVGPHDLDFKRNCQEMSLNVFYKPGWYHFRQIMKETFIENEFNSDSDEILTASYVIPLVPTQNLFDAQGEFISCTEKSNAYSKFSNDVIKIVSKIGSEICIVSDNVVTHNNIFEIAGKQFDLVKKSKSPGQLIETLNDLMTERQKTKVKSEFSKIIEDTIHKLQNVPRLTVKAAFKLMHDQVKKSFKYTKLPPMVKLRKFNFELTSEDNNGVESCEKRMDELNEQELDVELTEVLIFTPESNATSDLLDEGYNFSSDAGMENLLSELLSTEFNQVSKQMHQQKDENQLSNLNDEILKNNHEDLAKSEFIIKIDQMSQTESLIVENDGNNCKEMKDQAPQTESLLITVDKGTQTEDIVDMGSRQDLHRQNFRGPHPYYRFHPYPQIPHPQQAGDWTAPIRQFGYSRDL